MKTLCLPLFFGALVLLVAGCNTRSISDSSYDRYGRGSSGYRGELTEFEVLGVEHDGATTDAHIAAHLKDYRDVSLQATSKVLLIQSGADFPDSMMMNALSERFHLAGFSGKPVENRSRHPHRRFDPTPETEADERPANSYSKQLRLAAARGGYDKIICYWGVLESQQVNKTTKFVSWVPVVGYAVPDERQNMRIRLKAAIIDVATGRWTLVNPKPIESTSLSSIYSRRNTDQSLVFFAQGTGLSGIDRNSDRHLIQCPHPSGCGFFGSVPEIKNPVHLRAGSLYYPAWSSPSRSS